MGLNGAFFSSQFLVRGNRRQIGVSKTLGSRYKTETTDQEDIVYKVNEPTRHPSYPQTPQIPSKTTNNSKSTISNTSDSVRVIAGNHVIQNTLSTSSPPPLTNYRDSIVPTSSSAFHTMVSHSSTGLEHSSYYPNRPSPFSSSIISHTTSSGSSSPIINPSITNPGLLSSPTLSSLPPMSLNNPYYGIYHTPIPMELEKDYLPLSSNTSMDTEKDYPPLISNTRSSPSNDSLRSSRKRLHSNYSDDSDEYIDNVKQNYNRNNNTRNISIVSDHDIIEPSPKKQMSIGNLLNPHFDVPSSSSIDKPL
jgi:hypothetical protein